MVNNGNLKTHVESIYDRRTFQCNQSNFIASFKAGLNQHIRAAHEGVKYQCQHCVYKATQRGHLKTHVQFIIVRKTKNSPKNPKD